jgi:hypothetical protein
VEREAQKRKSTQAQKLEMDPTRIGENKQWISGKTTGAHHHQQR